MRLRMSLGLVISALFGLLFLIIAGQGLYGALSLRAIDAGTQGIQTLRIPALTLLGQMNADFGDVRVAQNGALDVPADQAASFLAAAKAASDKVRDEVTRYRPMLVDKEDFAYLAQIVSGLDTYDRLWGQVQSLTARRDHGAAMALFDGDALAAYNKVGDLIQGAVDDLRHNVSDEGQANLARILGTERAIYAGLALGAVVALTAMLFSSLYIIRPLKRMTTAMRALAEGDTEVVILGARRRDEVGAMAAALQVFKEGILRSRALEAEAAAAREAAAAERQRLQQEAEAAAQQRLLQATSGLATGLKRLAGGDLSFSLVEPLSPEFEALRLDLNAAVAQLAESIADVAAAADGIGQGAQEVNRSANDLSRRTEQQAAALEETAAALQEITQTVTAAAQRVEEARGVARAASSSAVHSGEVVREAIQAMQEIEESSRKISSIIGVIDEIAFQTNLLALNAGVEAARAGEAGRGFAVVATEVRALAQRSAEAAREIKTLISRSSAQVEKGVDLVRDTGQALETIQEHVQSINAGMEVIAQSAREQSTGLAEVNTAISQMDGVTQKNAAMVEETNAASTLLAEESRGLVKVVRRFTLHTPPSGASADRRNAA
ncbi:HAMP domain-containing methyl-accepting chemotaxis protein [Acidisoma sp. 7E03]